MSNNISNVKNNDNKKIDYAKAYLEDLEEMYNNFHYYSPISYVLDDHHYLNRWLEEGYEMAKKRVIKNNVDYYLSMLYYYNGFREGHLYIENLNEAITNRPFVDNSFSKTIRYDIAENKFYYIHDGIEEELLLVNKIPVKEYLNNYIIPYFEFDGETINSIMYYIIAHKILHFNMMETNNETTKKLKLTCKNKDYLLQTNKKESYTTTYNRILTYIEHIINIEIDHIYTEIIFDKYLWLNFPTFSIQKQIKSYSSILDNIVSKLNRVETLFIDLRTNSGGNIPVINHILYSLFRYIIGPDATTVEHVYRTFESKQHRYMIEDDHVFATQLESNIDINIRKNLKIVILISPYSYSACNIFLKLMVGYKNVFIYGHISKETYIFPSRCGCGHDTHKSKNNLVEYYVPTSMFLIKRHNNEDIEVKTRLLPPKFIYNRYIKNNHSQIELLMWLLNDIKENISL